MRRALEQVGGDGRQGALAPALFGGLRISGVFDGRVISAEAPAPPLCLDPPSEAEVWAKVPKFRNGCPPFYEVQRNNVRFLIEKIGDKLDPCKIYPLAGPCQLVHCHYKCTIYFDELYWSDYPIPFNHIDHRVEVIYIDKDHLRRCGGPPVATTPPS